VKHANKKALKTNQSHLTFFTILDGFILKILAVDIGGTNSRFAHFDVKDIHDINLPKVLSFKTKSNKIHSLTDLLNHFESVKTKEFEGLTNYDVLTFAVAGPVHAGTCMPPNIRWNIDISEIEVTKSLLINDFTAQSFGYLLPAISSTLIRIKEGAASPTGTIALIGAGTGLGHGALVPAKLIGKFPKDFFPVASEAGHAAFPFSGKDELEFERFLIKMTEKSYVYSELVVSGPGLSSIHEFLTGEILKPGEIAQKSRESTLTFDWFARFYGRACRQFCLSIYSTGGLIISGGIAIKNPFIVKSRSFMDEFSSSPSQANFLNSVPIFVNCEESIGLLGCAYYALKSLAQD